MNTMHIVLLGDSILDNRTYTGSDPDVVTHLRGLLPDNARATLLAVDGNTTSGIGAQAAWIPPDATHLVVSVGGNDALGHRDLLTTAGRLGSDPLRRLGQVAERFEADYRTALRPVLGRGLPVTLCTIYNGKLEDETEAARGRVALMLFNDVSRRARSRSTSARKQRKQSVWSRSARTRPRYWNSAGCSRHATQVRRNGR